MSEKFISINPELMDAGKFYRVYTDKDNATLILPKDVEDALYLDVEMLKDEVDGLVPSPADQVFVSSTRGLDTNDGTINKPFRTIQKALSLGYEIINLLPGTFTENLTIPSAYGLYGLIIQGYGTCESPKSEIKGTITIPAGVSRVRFKTLNLNGRGVGPAIIDDGSQGRHALQDITVTNAGAGTDLIRIVNGNNWWNVIGSSIEGIINLSGTGNNAMFNIMNSSGSFSCMPLVKTGYTFTAFSVGKLGTLTHSGGNIVCQYVGSMYPINGKILVSSSTNPLDYISMSNCAFTADGVNYGSIQTNGATVVSRRNFDNAFDDVCLMAVSTVNSLITTTASTLKAETKKVELGISYNTSSGEVTFNKTGVYGISAMVKVDCTEWNRKVEMWIEKYNGSAWDIVADTGFVRMFQTDQEVEVRYEFAGLFTSGDKYRLRAISDSNTTVSMSSQTLSNGVKMPSLRLSIHN